MTYRIFFEMKREPFAADVDLEHILVTPAVCACIFSLPGDFRSIER